MKTKLIGSFIATAIILCLGVSPIKAEEKKLEQSEPVDACEETLINKCSDCHHLTRVCQKLGKKGKGDWRRSIKRMIRKGAVLSKKEEKLLVQCLYKQQEGAQKACRK